MRYRIDDRRPRPLDIFRPQLFRPEGQAANSLAVRFYVLGGLGALLAYILFRLTYAAA